MCTCVLNVHMGTEYVETVGIGYLHMHIGYVHVYLCKNTGYLDIYIDHVHMGIGYMLILVIWDLHMY